MRVPFIRFVQGRNDYTDKDGRHYGWCIHNTSNDASDEGEASYAARRTDGVSSHFYHDKDSVTQSLDTGDKAGHVGSTEGNENSLASEFTGSNGKSRAWWLANVDWEETGRVMAYVLTHDPDFAGFQVRRASVAEMKANPKVKAFYGHDDCRRAWGGTTHTDPGPGFPWDRLFEVVNAALGQPTEGNDDVFCKYGDKGAKVADLQARIVAAGGSVGKLANGQPDIDSNYGDATARGLAALLGYGDGKVFGWREDVDLLVKLVQVNGKPGPTGPAGKDGAPGAPGAAGRDGTTPTNLRINGTAEVVR